MNMPKSANLLALVFEGVDVINTNRQANSAAYDPLRATRKLPRQQACGRDASQCGASVQSMRVFAQLPSALTRPRTPR